MDFMKLNKYNLANYDFVICIDQSYSMEATDCPGGITRWKQAHKWSKGLAHACAHYDKDGIDVVLFGSHINTYDGVKASTVDQIFRENAPNGSTPTTEALAKALSFKKSNKPMIILILTDGQPNNRNSLTNLIIKTTQNINHRSEIGISFLQVGNDSGAKQFLQMLDDDLEGMGAKHDIVDAKTYEDTQNITVEDILIGALTD